MISATSTVSMLGNDKQCKYILKFTKDNLRMTRFTYGNKVVIMALLLQFILRNNGIMLMSSNGNIFRVTGHMCGEFTGPGEFPAQRPVTRSFDVFFDLRLNKR